MKILRGAIIGCGKWVSHTKETKHHFRIGYAHGKGYENSSLVKLEAAADIDSVNLTTFAEQFGVKHAYSDYKKMLQEVKPDIVSICTWPLLHKEMVLDAVQAGVKGILCEKPAAFHYMDLKEMHEICRSHGVWLNINHQRRNQALFRSARQTIDEGIIGKLIRVEAYVGDGWDLLSWGIHWIDMIRYYNSDLPVSHVFAQADISNRTIRYNHPVEDRILMQLQFHNQVLGTLHVSPYLTDSGNIIVGDEGAIYLLPDRNVVIGRNGRYEIEVPQDQDPFADTIDQLATCLQTGEATGLDSESGLINMQITCAAYESARTHRTVTLPFEPDLNPLESWFEEKAAN